VTRKILCIAAVTAAGLGAQSAVAVSQAPAADLVEADLSQAGRVLLATVETRDPVPLSRLARQPAIRRPGARFLCLAVHGFGRRGERWFCLGGARDARRRVGMLLVNAKGRVVGRKTLRARVRRPGDRTLVLSLRPDRAGLDPHRYRWRVLENRSGCRGCRESVPARGTRVYRLRPVRPIGCTAGGGGVVYNGPGGRRLVALTFDDGPSSYTPGFLSVLRNKHAHGTFFAIGQEIAGREGTLRRALRLGNEIGIHTMHHDYSPSYWDLAATSALVRAVTHFEPCLFRPPGGALSSDVIQAAGALGMRTVLWNVDPSDWETQGSSVIYSRVVGAVQPGSIVIMHDGGGPRGGTLAALPSIIDTLRARGYRLVTVSALLGDRMIYRPYG
jgi:peptidoglycan/xylan/chitin deacetylase (PgdA/CDA1 family)